MSTLPGYNGGYALYVPKSLSHNQVYICPGVIDLNFSFPCSGGITLSDAFNFVSIININGQDYWRIENEQYNTGIGSLSGENIVPSSRLIYHG